MIPESTSQQVNNSIRLLIVGGVAGGASCAARARRLSDEAEIIVFERSGYASFSNCGLPYHVGGIIRDRQRIVTGNVDMLRQRFRIDVRTLHEVTRIDRQAKEIEVKNLGTGETLRERYDALVLSPGAEPVRPKLPGLDHPAIFGLRQVEDMDAIIAQIAAKDAKSAVVIGGGYIGLELAESLVHRGLSVCVIEKMDQVMPPMDRDVVIPVHDHLREKGVDLILGDGIAAIEPRADGTFVAVTESGVRREAPVVVLSIGVGPRVGLAREAGLEIGERGGIRVDEQMRTSDPAIWAVGDAVETRDVVTGEWTLLPLAGPANRQGRLAADAIFGRSVRFRGVQGTSVVKVFDLTLAQTGASEKTLRRLGRPFEKVYIHSTDHATYYPGAKPLLLKVLFDPERGAVLGAQGVGRAGVEKRIDVIAMAIQMGATVHDLAEAELCYAPQCGMAKDPINLAGFVAENHISGDSPLAQWDGIERAPLILDVRTERERQQDKVPGSVGIPVDELRDRLGELPRDRQIWAYCRVGVRSHAATRLLRLHGFDARNISGGFKQCEIHREMARGDRG
jgi:NADPH-dependent 2,4-dienoyl-CoA reductase/sulfur reductase-like enzyme/rhodanese-related sulfurtransferase